MAFGPKGSAKSPAHAAVNRRHAAEWKTFGGQAHQAYQAIDVRLDLKPLANALRFIAIDDRLYRGELIARAINRGLERFKGRAHRELKALTKIRRPTRLKKGVRLRRARASDMLGKYIIRDRNIRITKAYFGAKYSPYGTPGANARWGRPFNPAGATWTSWDGTRTGKRTFMIPGRAPVFIRFNHVKRLPLMPVFGPNPAELMRIHAPKFQSVLFEVANAYLQKEVMRAYRKSEAKAKARFGL